jgi:orotidine-5'-phosphate decarboxylase
LSPGEAPQLAFAADLPRDQALALYRRVRSSAAVAKVGLSLFIEHGPPIVEAFLAEGARVFLDLKLHDIPHQLRLAAARAGALGASYLTVHALAGRAGIRAAIEGAVEGAGRSGLPAPRILAVTLLTSHSDAELPELQFQGSSADLVSALGRLAIDAGAGGLVCSPHEAALLRCQLGPDLFLCTPGIRPAGAAWGDQARAATPREAVKAGARLLVVGRPFAEAQNPEQLAATIEAEIRNSIP